MVKLCNEAHMQKILKGSQETSSVVTKEFRWPKKPSLYFLLDIKSLWCKHWSLSLERFFRHNLGLRGTKDMSSGHQSA